MLSEISTLIMRLLSSKIVGSEEDGTGNDREEGDGEKGVFERHLQLRGN